VSVLSDIDTAFLMNASNKIERIGDNKINKILFLIYLIHSRPTITQDEMSAEVGVGINTVKRWLETLDEWYGVKIKRDGSPRYGRYEISDWGVLDPIKVQHKFQRVA